MSHGQLRIWPALVGARIAPEIYGHEMEMVGRCIYDGIWAGRASRRATEDGIRLELLAVLKHLRIPLLKWPGEDFAAHYHWRDGVGTGERPHRMNVPWQQIEPNAFGLHEFMHLCEKLDCAPWVTCNGVTGSLEEALSWVEYATFGGETDRTHERAQNGNPDPYDIRLWSAAGPGSPWPAGVLSAAGSELTEIAPYEAFAGPVALKDTPQSAPVGMYSLVHPFRDGPGQGFGRGEHERSFAEVQDLETRLRRCIAGLECAFGAAAPPLALRSWGVWHDEATAENGLEQPNTLRDALVAASVYNVLNQNAARIQAAALAHAVNALQCLAVTDGQDMFLTPNYHVAEMMTPHRGARVLAQRLEGPAFDVDIPGTTAPVSVPALSVSASRTGKRVCITVVNRGYTDAMPINVEIREAGIAALSGRLLHSDAVTDENSVGEPKNVAPVWLKLTPDGNTFHDVLPPHSLASYMVTLGQG